MLKAKYKTLADAIFEKKSVSTRIIEAGVVLFYLSLAVFLLIAATIGGVFFLNRAQLQAQEQLRQQIKTKETNLETGVLSQIFLLDKRLKNLRKILSTHVAPSNVISFLELNTLPDVRLGSLNVDIAARRMDTGAVAANFATVAKQIGIFERSDQVERVEFGGLSIGNERQISFRLSITFKEGFMIYKP